MIKKFKDFTNEGVKREYGCVMLYFDIPNWNNILKKINKEDLIALLFYKIILLLYKYG